MKHIALITGITGQDGSFLAEFLLEKGYEVHGTIRRSSVDYRERIAHLEGTPNFHLHYADLGDSMSIMQIIGKIRTGTTRIGKYILNHSFMMPGIVSTAVAIALGLLFIQFF